MAQPPGFFETFNPQAIVPLALKKFDLDMKARQLNILQEDHDAKMRMAADQLAARERLRQFMKPEQPSGMYGMEEPEKVTRTSDEILNFMLSEGAEKPEDVLKLKVGMEAAKAKTPTGHWQTYVNPENPKEIKTVNLGAGEIPPPGYITEGIFKATQEKAVDETKGMLPSQKLRKRLTDIEESGTMGPPEIAEIEGINRELSKIEGVTPTKEPEDKLSEAALTQRALRGDQEAKDILAAMEARKLRIAQANRTAGSAFKEGTIDYMVELYETTGQVPAFGMGTAGAPQRAAFWDKVAERAKLRGDSGAEQVARSAETKALTNSLSNQEKIKGMMGGFVRNIDKQVDRVDEVMGDIVSRVGVRAIDLPMRELRIRVKGSGSEAIISAYLMEISNEIGKLSTGSAASIRELSVDAQKQWQRVHDPNLSLSELKGILAETKNMGKMRIESSDEEIELTKRKIRRNRPVGVEQEKTPTVVPRKPGESISDYLKRTSGQ